MKTLERGERANPNSLILGKERPPRYTWKGGGGRLALAKDPYLFRGEKGMYRKRQPNFPKGHRLQAKGLIH